MVNLRFREATRLGTGHACTLSLPVESKQYHMATFFKATLTKAMTMASEGGRESGHAELL
jgi:hypothetical protein